MDKQEFLDRTAMGGVLHDDRKLLLTAIEGSDPNMVTDFLLTQLQLRTTQLIMHHNETIANSIRALVQFKEWPNLLQIFRALPDDVVRASDGEGLMSERWKQWAEVIKKFNGLSATHRILALELLDKHLEEEKNA